MDRLGKKMAYPGTSLTLTVQPLKNPDEPFWIPMGAQEEQTVDWLTVEDNELLQCLLQQTLQEQVLGWIAPMTKLLIEYYKSRPSIFLWSVDMVEGVECKRKWACSNTALKLSTKLAGMIQQLPCEISFSGRAPVSGRVMERVLTYLEHHKGRPLPPLMPKPLPRGATMRDLCREDPWDADLIDLVALQNRQFLFELTSLANAMDIISLVYLSMARMGMMMRELPLSEMQRRLDPKQQTEPVRWNFDDDGEGQDRHRMVLSGASVPRDCACLPPFEPRSVAIDVTITL
jgi:hypothetical protein